MFSTGSTNLCKHYFHPTLQSISAHREISFQIIPSVGSMNRSVPKLAIAKATFRPPNRMTVAFNAMKKSCPDAIQAYAVCVSSHHNVGSLEKGSCSSEFAVVRECYRQVRSL